MPSEVYFLSGSGDAQSEFHNRGMPHVGEVSVVVSDESGIDQRIQSVAFVSGPESAMVELNGRCKQALGRYGTSEVKFTEIGDARKRAAAGEALDFIFDDGSVRVLVLSWDTQDRRHAVQGRDDTANLHRMLFHGLRRNADWQCCKRWKWFPDEKSDLDHEAVQAYLNNTREARAYLKHQQLFELHRDFLEFSQVSQRASTSLPLIGVADVFAGMVRFSITEAERCLKAVGDRRESGASTLLDLESVDLGNRGPSAKARFVADFYLRCRSRRCGVSLRNKRRLATFNEKGRFLFWHYEPQGDYDRAPTRF